jgi:hypothetical protein
LQKISENGFYTTLKDFSFKFYVDNKSASLSILSIAMTKKNNLFEKLTLKTFWKKIYQRFSFEKNTLESGKTISRIWVEKLGVRLVIATIGMKYLTLL